MIDRAVQYLIAEANRQLNVPANQAFIIPGNIARVDAGAPGPNQGELESRVVLTVVNIEEEKVLKNTPHFTKHPNNTLTKFSPPVFLNLYVLFSCANTGYDVALGRISRVIGFFQSRNMFTAANAAVSFPAGIEKLLVEMQSLGFENLNHLWGVLGGKYYPSVLYKVRMLLIQESVPQGADQVLEVQVEGKDTWETWIKSEIQQ